ncbi:uncharacterized protein LOC117344544 [Pecten maximus]|uniref:uncharacterized protein LOC117344544 n=1 Tax=Pecten maximus TaxID=6579 RepID=UPI0014582FD5|nr:uncharacterized protein LOC117344544 [Pecten maximus]XP_033763209.1 uncharacterized protein LOC117344544 [Pecten maximus]XP_033763210.1 uncharacterized protein LOC117344544 [Pecten maximus]XP_033763211.1 uncharacterized protein LOC117344544 [Pecten maximus]
MGHVQSKKKKTKKVSDVNYSTQGTLTGDVDSLRQIKFNRMSADIERLSLSSGYHSRDSLLGPDFKQKTMSLNRNNNVSKDLNLMKDSFSYERLNVDDHPALTKLQNEQNRRLEKMEERMSQIRIHAMQEAERRKYAHLFKAKKKESPTRELLCKAKDKLKLSTCDTSLDITSKNTSLNEEVDKGEIIPVTVATETQIVDGEEIDPPNYLQNLPALGAVNLNDPKSIFFLPFLFPIFIFMILVRSVSQSDVWQRTGHTPTRQKKRN